MSILKLVQSRIVGVPLLVTEGKLQEIVSALDGRLDLKMAMDSTDPTIYAYQPNLNRPTMHYPVNVSVVPIQGTLVHKSSGMSAMSGVMSYDQIAVNFDAALDNPNTDTIVLDVNSPGGEVSGCFDLVDYIYQSRGIKHIIAFINDIGCSAAYALASSASVVYSTRTAHIGSIGVLLVHTDQTAANAAKGVKYIVISKGDHKADFSPNNPLSESALADAQLKVNTIYDLFVSTVVRNMGLSSESVINTQAQVYLGQDALSHGLSHHVVVKSEFLTSLTNKKKGITMSATNPVQPTVPVSTPTQGSTPAQVPTAPVINPINTAVDAEKSRVLEILEACELGNCAHLAVDLISNNSTPDIARKIILSCRAAVSASTHINSTQATKTDADTQTIDPDVLVKIAESRAGITTTENPLMKAARGVSN